MTDREQHLRNEVGQLTHKMHRMIKQREEMQADLIRQREDMTQALATLSAGELRRAAEILQAGLDYRDRTREKRKHAGEAKT
jgi:methylphosphotriester-DNA--protein-cysteine methyltransferase